MTTLFVAFEDFILIREAALCSPETIDFYGRMLKPFLSLANGTQPSNRMVREFLSAVAQRGVSSATVHAHARAVRAFLRFAYEESWIEEPVTVRMPRIEQKRMKVLSRKDVKQVLSVCTTRDRALVLTLIDSGLRRDGSQRSSAIFPLKPSGGATLMARLSEKSSVHITFHKCRRTFATWALRNGIDLLSLQRLLGHTSLEMVRRYAQQTDADLRIAHERVGLVESLLEKL